MSYKDKGIYDYWKPEELKLVAKSSWRLKLEEEKEQMREKIAEIDRLLEKAKKSDHEAFSLLCLLENVDMEKSEKSHKISAILRKRD